VKASICPLLQKGALDAKLRQLAYFKAWQFNHCNYGVTHSTALGETASIANE